jgi:hypothetical protein
MVRAFLGSPNPEQVTVSETTEPVVAGQKSRAAHGGRRLRNAGRHFFSPPCLARANSSARSLEGIRRGVPRTFFDLGPFLLVGPLLCCHEGKLSSGGRYHSWFDVAPAVEDAFL